MSPTFKPGFYTALGTPIDRDGSVAAGSLCAHVEDQIHAGASGLLVLGSMGIQAYIRNHAWLGIARTASEAVRGSIPLMVGVMDTSIGRVLDRIEALGTLQIDGVVATVPYYNTLTQSEVVEFFTRIAASSPFPVYMYDLPVVTKTAISHETAETLRNRVPNIKGIKTGNLKLARDLERTNRDDGAFSIMYSTLDTFDTAYLGGITKNLDGMFACTSTLAARMYQALAQGDQKEGSSALDAIVRIRDVFVSTGVFRGFTAAMNLLGFKGSFHPDYSQNPDEQTRETVKHALTAEGLL